MTIGKRVRAFLSGGASTPDPGEVAATYAPEIDGEPDPGEVVWAWVPYEDDPQQGKDRPVLVLAAGHAATGSGVLLLTALVLQVQMLQQLIPVVRFDGYYVLSDLAGVPDLFARVGPVLRSLRPGHPDDPRVSELRPRSRRFVTA